METRECKYELCNENFPLSRKDRQFCSRGCKNKHKNRTRYYNDDDYNQKKKDESIENYQTKKKASYKRVGELTEQEIEHLKTIRPEWFSQKNDIKK